MRLAALRFSRRCAFANAFSSARKNLGLAICSPVESVANEFKPTSMPLALSFAGSGCVSISTEKQAYHLPVAERVIVRVLILPSMGRCNLIRNDPILERRNLQSFRAKPD